MRFVVTAVVAFGLMACSRREPAKTESPRDSGETADSLAKKAGKAAHELAEESKEAAKKVGKTLKKAAKEAHEGWEEAEKEDKAKGKK